MLFLNEDSFKDRVNFKVLECELMTKLQEAEVGRAQSSPRLVLPLGETAALGAMLAFDEASSLAAAKILLVAESNRAKNLNPHQGLIVLFKREGGKPLAVIEASLLTAVRTAALASLATNLLAKKEASTLAIYGTGLLAHFLAKAIYSSRKIDAIHIYGRNAENLRRIKKSLGAELNLEIQVHSDPKKAAANAEIHCLATAAKEAYLSRYDLLPSAHINAMGASRPGVKEINLAGIETIYVDDAERVREESEEIRDMAAPRRLVSLGKILSRKIEGRKSDEEQTFFKSVGSGICDLVVADHVLRELAK